MSWNSWKPYVPVAKRRQQAAKRMEALRKKGVDIQPIEIEGRKIAKTFWGEAWCSHLESFSDYANRLPRGRTYARNGSVCHLAIKKGNVEAKVSGSELYNVQVHVKPLTAKKWGALKRQCSGQIGSLLELLQGDLSDHIMQVVTDRKEGLFPLTGEISFECDCPDWAVMCKHVAAVLYGVGARLDQDPALLFLLRGVNQDELIDADAQITVPGAARSGGTKRLAPDDLGDVFDIDLVTDETEDSAKDKVKAKKASSAKKKPAVRTKTPSVRTGSKGTDKVSVRKKTTKAANKPTAPKSTKKKSEGSDGTSDQVKSTRSRKGATKKTVKKKAT